MAAYSELTLDQGADYAGHIVLTEDDGTPIDVTGSTFVAQIRKSYYSANVSANLVMTITDAANGNVRLSLDAANTANIKAGRYLYDIKRTDANNAVTRLVEGIITVTPQVSQ